VKFAGGTWAYSPMELKKAKCADSSPELVASYAASQYFGEGMTCKTAKDTNLCKTLVTYCAASCGFCGEAAEIKANHTEALVEIKSRDPWDIAHGGWEKDSHASLLGTDTKCVDAEADKVEAFGESAAYGKGMTCARAKKEGHCDTLADQCKATCGLCEQVTSKVGVAVGDVVSWKAQTYDVPKGTVGIVETVEAYKITVHFPTGTWAFSPDELEKAACVDSPAEVVADFAESQHYGVGITCELAKNDNLCDSMSLYCARSCNFCEDTEAQAVKDSADQASGSNSI